MPLQKITPGPGQESVWDYPRPPRLEVCSKHIRVIACGITLADTHNGRRVLETSHPPVYYLPPEDVRRDLLIPTGKQSWCEWKGAAIYFDLKIEDTLIRDVAWGYPSPVPAFADLTGFLAFYPHLVDACYVDDEQVQPQAGGFYGGWITSDVVGPFKGEPGTLGW